MAAVDKDDLHQLGRDLKDHMEAVGGRTDARVQNCEGWLKRINGQVSDHHRILGEHGAMVSAHNERLAVLEQDRQRAAGLVAAPATLPLALPQNWSRPKWAAAAIAGIVALAGTSEGIHALGALLKALAQAIVHAGQ